MLFWPGLIVNGPTSKCIFVAPSRSGSEATVVVVLNGTVICGSCVVAGACVVAAAVLATLADVVPAIAAGDVAPCVAAAETAAVAADCDFEVLSVPHAAASRAPVASVAAIRRRALIAPNVTAIAD